MPYSERPAPDESQRAPDSEAESPRATGSTAAPPVAEYEFSESSPPSAVTATFWLGIACVVVGFALLGGAYLFITDAELWPIVEAMAAQGQPVTTGQARLVYASSLVGTGIFTIVLAILWITSLVFLRKGRTWARIVITTIGVIWVLFTLPSLFGTSAGGGITMALAGLQVLVLVATLVVAFRPGANRFFEAARRGSSEELPRTYARG